MYSVATPTAWAMMMGYVLLEATTGAIVPIRIYIVANNTIFGNYLQNMTFTGVEQTLGKGLVQKTYEYPPLNALVDIFFNSAGQVVSATVVGTASSMAATATAA